MKEHGFSQLPVLSEDGKVLGIVNEKKVLERMLEQHNAADGPIDALIEGNYCVVDAETSIAVLSDLFSQARVAILVEDNKISAVISRIDLIDYMARLSR
jgi:cystathionine beta-synthase